MTDKVFTVHGGQKYHYSVSLTERSRGGEWQLHFNSLLERKRGERVKGRAGGERDSERESRSTGSSITTRSDRQWRAEWALLGSSS